MNQLGSFFVKLNCNNIDNIRGLIIDSEEKYIMKPKDKYMICAGKYDKNGWTLIFRARTLKEAQELINANPFRENKRIMS